MARTTTVSRGAAFEVEEGRALTCECWDCRSHRRHLVKLAVVALLACGLGGQVAWRAGLWRAAEAQPAAEVEPGAALAPALGELF